MNLNKIISSRFTDRFLTLEEFSKRYVFPINKVPIPLPKGYAVFTRSSSEMSIIYKNQSNNVIQTTFEVSSGLVSTQIILYALKLNDQIKGVLEKPVNGISYHMFEVNVELRSSNLITNICHELDDIISTLPRDLQDTFGTKDIALISKLVQSRLNKYPRNEKWEDLFPITEFPKMHPPCIADIMLSNHFDRNEKFDSEYKEALEKNKYVQLAILLIRAKRMGHDLDIIVCTQQTEESLIKSLKFHGTSLEKALGIITNGASQSKRNKFEGDGDAFYSTEILGDVNFLSDNGYAFQASSEEGKLSSDPTIYIFGTLEEDESIYVPATSVDRTTPKGHSISKEGSLLIPVMMIKLRTTRKAASDELLSTLNQFGKFTLDHFETAYKSMIEPKYQQTTKTRSIIGWVKQFRLTRLEELLADQEPQIIENILMTLKNLHLSPEDQKIVEDTERKLTHVDSSVPPVDLSLQIVRGRTTTVPIKRQDIEKDWIHSISEFPQEKNHIILCESEQPDELRIIFNIGTIKSVRIKKADVLDITTLEDLIDYIKTGISYCYTNVQVDHLTLIKKDPQPNTFAAAIPSTPPTSPTPNSTNAHRSHHSSTIGQTTPPTLPTPTSTNTHRSHRSSTIGHSSQTIQLKSTSRHVPPGIVRQHHASRNSWLQENDYTVDEDNKIAISKCLTVPRRIIIKLKYNGNTIKSVKDRSEFSGKSLREIRQLAIEKISRDHNIEINELEQFELVH